MNDSLQKTKIILVIGMHRSGTSALTGLLNILGFNLNDQKLMIAGPDNEKGYWEHKGIAQLNERIFALFDQTWYSYEPLPQNWQADSRLQTLVDEARQILKEDFSHFSHWALKDPRLCRLLPFWLPLLQEFDADIYYLHIIRNPLEVAQSLKKRDDLTAIHSYLLWLEYNLAAEKATRNLSRFFIQHEDLLKKPGNIIKNIETNANLYFPKKFELQRNEIENFLNSELRHHCYTPEDIDQYVPYLPLSEIYKIFLKNGQFTPAERNILEKHRLFLDVFKSLYQDEFNMKHQLILLKNECDILRNELHQARQAHHETHAELYKTQLALNQSQLDYQLMMNSLSWKITEPLRKAKKIFNKS